MNNGDKDYFEAMQRHEFSHSFVNPLTDKHWEQAKTYAHLYDALPAQQVCGEWNECVNEYVIRAVTTYLAFQESRTAGQAALEAERGRNVVFIDDLQAYATMRRTASSIRRSTTTTHACSKPLPIVSQIGVRQMYRSRWL